MLHLTAEETAYLRDEAREGFSANSRMHAISILWRARAHAQEVAVAAGFRTVWTVLLVWALCFLACCARRPSPVAPRGWDPDQAQRAVLLEVTCTTGDLFADPPKGHVALSWGSGVVASEREVYTAAHVADCSRGSALIRAVSFTGAKRMMHVVGWDPWRDRATLAPDVPFYGYRAATLAAPVEGETICAQNAFPARTRSCHVVGRVRDHLIAKYSVTVDVDMSGSVEHGNSGAGLWDQRGRLVGVVTHLRPCFLFWEEGCGGWATTIAGWGHP